MKPVSGKRMCRILEGKGWVLVRTKGSHHIYRFPGQSQLIVVPVHKNNDLKAGTQHAIMRVHSWWNVICSCFLLLAEDAVTKV